MLVQMFHSLSKKISYKHIRLSHALTVSHFCFSSCEWGAYVLQLNCTNVQPGRCHITFLFVFIAVLLHYITSRCFHISGKSLNTRSHFPFSGLLISYLSLYIRYLSIPQMVLCVNVIVLAVCMQIWQRMQQWCSIKVLDTLWLHMLMPSAELGRLRQNKAAPRCSSCSSQHLRVFVRNIHSTVTLWKLWIHGWITD